MCARDPPTAISFPSLYRRFRQRQHFSWAPRIGPKRKLHEPRLLKAGTSPALQPAARLQILHPAQVARPQCGHRVGSLPVSRGSRACQVSLARGLTAASSAAASPREYRFQPIHLSRNFVGSQEPLTLALAPTKSRRRMICRIRGHQQFHRTSLFSRRYRLHTSHSKD
jgi:hypothetical protein